MTTKARPSNRRIASTFGFALLACAAIGWLAPSDALAGDTHRAVTACATQLGTSAFLQTPSDKSGSGKTSGKSKDKKKQQQRTEKPDESARREYDLPGKKAAAFFTLLKPDDVKVLVGQQDGGVFVEGTKREAAVIDRFVKLITREQGRQINDWQAYVSELERTWDTKKEYSLPAPKADSLFQILAFEDVPVLVARTSGGVTIDASKSDQKTIQGMIQILRGKRLKAGKSDERAQAKKDDTKSRRSKAEKRAKQDKKADKGEFAERREALEERVRQMHSELEKKVAELHEKARHLQDEAEKLHRKMREETERLTKDLARAAENIERRIEGIAGSDDGGKKGKQDDNAVVVREYELPKHHADSLFTLFAPDDIRDVIVSREGNVIRIRATVRDQKSIAGIVDILKRGHSSGETAAGEKPARRRQG